MKIVFTAKGKDWDAQIDPRFGRADYLLIYNRGQGSLEIHDNDEINQEAHGAGPKTAQKIFELGANVIITGNGPGGNAARVLENAGVEIYIGAGKMNLREAYEAYEANKLEKF